VTIHKNVSNFEDEDDVPEINNSTQILKKPVGDIINQNLNNSTSNNIGDNTIKENEDNLGSNNLEIGNIFDM